MMQTPPSPKEVCLYQAPTRLWRACTQAAASWFVKRGLLHCRGRRAQPCIILPRCLLADLFVTCAEEVWCYATLGKRPPTLLVLTFFRTVCQLRLCQRTSLLWGCPCCPSWVVITTNHHMHDRCAASFQNTLPKHTAVATAGQAVGVACWLCIYLPGHLDIDMQDCTLPSSFDGLNCCTPQGSGCSTSC